MRPMLIDRNRAPRALALAALLLAGAASLYAPAARATSAVVKTEQATAELVAHAPQGVLAGQPLWLGLKIDHKPHWHTYWKNPGDSGLPTTMAFQLPAGFVAGEIAWPTPKPLPVGPLVNFGYEGALLLPVPVTVPATFAGESLTVKLRGDWLICKDVCIPEGGDFELVVPARAATSAHAALFDAARAAVPQPVAGAAAVAQIRDGALAVEVKGLPSAWHGKALQFLPELAGVIDNAAKPESRWQDGVWRSRVPLSPQRSESPSTLPVVLTVAGGTAGAAIPVAVEGAWPAPGAPGSAAPPAVAAIAATSADSGALGWWAALGGAVLGGLLLNLMPCVFPVLSLKVLGFASHASQRRALLAGGIAYTVGVVVSFVGLAALLLALRAGGEQVGWGFQLQSPAFVALLAALFTLIGLNLAGVFEFGSFLPGNLASARARHPLVDSALTGVLAVAVASPCTAPFMGASLGLAATLPTGEALSVFVALGLGMALPYLAASAWPGLAALLPRPGAWMAHLKTLMAFPMFATVVWLVWVLGQQVGIDGAAALLGLLVSLGLVTWALGSPTLVGRARTVLGTVSLAVLAAALAWAGPALHEAPPATAVTGTHADRSGAAWQPWSVERVQAALAEGRPVFVDFTAAWCVTCQYNKRTTLSDAEVMADFERKRVVLLRADWTRRDPAITAELTRLQRNGVPVYAWYAPGSAGPRLLSEILSVREVRDLLGGLP